MIRMEPFKSCFGFRLHMIDPDRLDGVGAKNVRKSVFFGYVTKAIVYKIVLCELSFVLSLRSLVVCDGASFEALKVFVQHAKNVSLLIGFIDIVEVPNN